jgi:CRP/FNR family cyclic AMP-dependent transcriptional regulator
VLGYFGAGEFVGEMGLFVESDRREVILRTRTPASWPKSATSACISCWPGRWPPMPRACCTPGPAADARLLDTSRKASRLPFWTFRPDRPHAARPGAGTGGDEPSAGQPAARLAPGTGPAGRLLARNGRRVLKKLQADGLLHARGKTVVLYGTR